MSKLYQDRLFQSEGNKEMSSRLNSIFEIEKKSGATGISTLQPLKIKISNEERSETWRTGDKMLNAYFLFLNAF